MKRKLIALALALCLTLGLTVPAAAYTPEEQFQVLQEILPYIENNAYDLPAGDRAGLLMKALEAMFLRTEGAYDAFMDGLMSVFDSHSMYIPAGGYDDAFASGGTTVYVGVGITMQLDPRGVLVTEVAQDGPALKAGIQPGDLIIQADGADLAGMTLEQIRARITGPEGTPVVLAVERLLRTFPVTVERSRVEQRTFDSWEIEEGIYYMDYNNFADSTDFIGFIFGMKEMVELQSKVLILDLRDNPGGVLTYGLSALNRLIPDAGLDYFGIETRQDGELTIQWHTSEGIGPRLNKIIILQNGETASAAEVMTSSLHDLGYAITVGTDSYGKARMQNHLTMTDGSAAVITTGRLVPPHQLDFEGMGLYPDWLIPARSGRHPAADCRLLESQPIPLYKYSANGKLLNEALIALGYLSQSDLEQGTGWVGDATMTALRLFQDDYGLIHRAAPDAATVNRINEVLAALQSAPAQGDLQLEKALELARPYLLEPLQYTVDELGNFKNIR